MCQIRSILSWRRVPGYGDPAYAGWLLRHKLLQQFNLYTEAVLILIKVVAGRSYGVGKSEGGGLTRINCEHWVTDLTTFTSRLTASSSRFLFSDHLWSLCTVNKISKPRWSETISARFPRKDGKHIHQTDPSIILVCTPLSQDHCPVGGGHQQIKILRNIKPSIPILFWTFNLNSIL